MKFNPSKLDIAIILGLVLIYVLGAFYWVNGMTMTASVSESEYYKCTAKCDKYIK